MSSQQEQSPGNIAFAGIVLFTIVVYALGLVLSPRRTISILRGDHR